MDRRNMIRFVAYESDISFQSWSSSSVALTQYNSTVLNHERDRSKQYRNVSEENR